MIHEQLRAKIQGRMKVNAVTGKLANDRQQDRIVLLVVASVAEPHVQCPSIGQQFQDPPWPEQLGLLDLAGHHDVADTRPLVQPDGFPQAGEPGRGEVITAGSQFLRGQAVDPDAVDLQPPLSRRPGEGQGKPAGPGQQPDPTVVARRSIGCRKLVTRPAEGCWRFDCHAAVICLSRAVDGACSSSRLRSSCSRRRWRFLTVLSNSGTRFCAIRIRNCSDSGPAG